MSAVYNKVNCFFGFDNCENRRIYQISGYAAFEVVGTSKVKVDKTWEYSVQLRYKGMRHCYNRAPIAVKQDLTTPEDTPLNFVVKASDEDNDKLISGIVNQPQHGSVITQPDGSYVYTPSENYYGEDSITFEITDGFATTQVTQTITITPVNDAPVAKNQQLQLLEDTTQTITLFGSDVDSEQLTYSIVKQPEHGKLAIQNNQVVYTPEQNYNGQDTFSYLVSDGQIQAKGDIHLDILPVNDAPIAKSGTVATNEDTPIDIKLEASDPDSSNLQYTLQQLPTNGEITIENGVVHYIPNKDFSGNDQFTFIVTDGELTSTGTIDINVNPINDAPNAQSQNVTTLEDTEIAITLNATDIDSDKLTYQIKTQPSHGTVILEGSIVKYMPAKDYNGQDSFVFEVSDGDKVSEANVSIEVTPVDDAPVLTAKDLVKTTFKNTSLDINLIQDNQLEGDYTFKVVGQPTQGTVVLADGKIIYQPNPNFTGDDSLTYQITNQEGVSNIAKIDIKVIEPSNEGREFWLTFLPNYSPSDALTLFITSQTNATVTVEIPQLNVKKQIEVAANSATSVELGEYYKEINLPSKSKTKLGIHVYSNELISTYALNQLQYTTDAASIIPIQSLGLRYMYAGFKQGNNSREELLSIVAIQNNTELTINKSNGDLGSNTPKISETIKVILAKGETYYLNGGLLGGTTVDANYPIAVFSGNICSAVVTGGACDHLFEQIASVDNWSKEVITSPLATRKKGDTFRVYSAFDNTKVYINQKLVTTLQAGGIYQTILDGGNRIQSNNPIWVNQFSNSSDYDGVTSDPFMMGIASTANYLKSYTITTPTKGFVSHYLNVIIKKSQKDTIKLDNQLLQNITWQDILGTDYQFAQIKVEPGIHTVVANDKFGLSVYGFGSYDSYGYNGGFNFINKAPEADNFLEVSEDNELAINQIPENAVIEKQPLKGILTKTSTGYTYLPQANFYGIDEVRYQYTDESGNLKDGFVLIDILPVDDKPQDEVVKATTKEDTLVDISFNNLDFDNEKLTFKLVNAGKSKQVQLLRSEAGKEIYRYTPADNYYGEDEITFEISDGKSTAKATAKITITPVNDAPTVTPFTVKTTGDSITFDISKDEEGNARGTDIEDGTNLTYYLGSAQNGTATQQGNLITFTPAAGFDGLATVYYYAKDSQGLAGQTKIVTVNVERINDTPVAQALKYTINEDTTATIKLQASDEENAPLTYSILQAPQHGMLEGEGQNLVYKPNPNYFGTDSFVYGANDGNSIGNATVTIIVNPVNDAPIVQNQTLTIEEDTPVSITLKADDADGDNLVYEMTSLGSKGVLTGSLPQFVYTPKANQTGTDTLNFRVYDGKTYAYGTINITITPVNDAPIPKDISQTLSEDSSGVTLTLYATDPENNPITYRLKSEPAHGTATLKNGNQVFYVPNKDFNGEDKFEFEASDGTLSQVGSITLTVSPQPDKPIADSTTETVAKNRTSVIGLKASDVDGDNLTYTILTQPTHGKLTENGSLPNYTPNTDYEGADSVKFRVSDGTYTADGVVTINVTTLPNRSPVWQSAAPTQIEATKAYQYTLLAYDPDATAISYQLDANAPTGMTLTGNVINWTPTNEQVGAHSINVIATDAEGSSTTQTFVVNVLETSVAPQITSQPPMQSYAGKVYRYQVIASDSNKADVLSYSIANAPNGMSINKQTGEIIWQATAEGVYKDIKVMVSDGRWIVSQTYTLTILKAVPLKVTLNAADSVDVNQPYNISVVVAGGSSDTKIELTNDGEPVPVDSNGKATITPTKLGQHQLAVKATDGNETSTASKYYIVKDASDTTAPTIGFNDKSDVLFITKPTDITGTINDNTAVVWETVLYDSYDPTSNNTPIVWQKSGTGSVSGAIATIDPTLLTNGAYTLVVKVTDAGGNTTQQTKNIVIDGNMKVGELAFTLKDAEINMPNLDITVERSYDSRLGYKSGDFGQGWNLGLQTIKMRQSRPIHTGWQAKMTRIIAAYQNVTVGTICIEPVNGGAKPTVTITLPDGNVETYQVEFDCRQGTMADGIPTPGIQFTYQLKPIGDTQSTFDIVGTHSIELKDGKWTTDSGVDVDENGNVVTNWFVPQQFFITLKDGTRYDFNKQNVTKVTYPNGQYLTIDNTGINHSLGTKATFTRDANNRITRVSLPDNRYWQYSYDSRGDLINVTDPTGVQNLYTYDNNHRLLKITDKDGVLLTGYEYDEAGRLIAMLDAKGNRVKLEHQLDNNSEVVTDARGFKTTYTYDDYGNVTQEIDPFGNITKRSYNTNYDKLSETDANGHTTTWTYDDKHNKLSETNALGQTTTYSYDKYGQLLSETDHLGRVTAVNSYDSSGQLTSLKDVAGNTTSMTYDSTGLTSLTDAMGNTTAYTYTGDDISKVTDSVGTTRTYTYDANNRKTSETVTYKRYDGSNTSYTNNWSYDAKGRVVSETVAGVTTTKTYGTSDELLTSQVGSDKTTYVYDANKKLVQTIHPDGSASEKAYDANGNVVSEKDALGNVTSFEYDALSRKVKTTLPNGAITITAYDAVGNVISETDANGNVTQYAYDALNRKVAMTDSLGNTHAYAFDNLGRLSTETDKLGRVTKYVYNDLGQRTQVIYADGSSVQTSYDALGRKLSETNELGQTTQYGYDSTGKLIKVTDSLGNITQYAYDGLGNKTAQTDALGRVTKWTYDSYGRGYQQILPNGAYTLKGYDGKGRISYEDDYNRKRKTYAYDSLDRLVQTTYADGSSDITDYNALGQRIKTTRNQTGNSQVSRYSYDKVDNLTQEVKPNGDILNYQYDNNGNKTVMSVVASGTTQTSQYGYDKLNRLVSTTDSTGTTQYTYNAVGSKVSETKPNGVATQYRFNAKNQLTGITHQRGDTVLATYAYTLDALGNRSQLVETVYGDTPVTTTSTWQYDNLGRLISETVNGQVTTHEYDAVSNRIKQTQNGQVTSYSYDVNDRLISETGARTASYNYDNQGNTLTQTVNGTLNKYSYNAKDELIQADDVAFGYDIDGIRNAKSKNGVTIDYITDKNRDYAQVIVEKQNNFPVASYSYGDDLISQNVNGNTSFYGYDGLGSTKFLTDTTGKVTDSYQYNAYGEVTSKTGNTDNNYLYAGEQFDRSLNQYYLRARYYNQGIGRFTQMDTWQGRANSPITLNKYLYANSNPVMNIDPSGNFSLGEFGATMNGYATLATMSYRSVSIGRTVIGTATKPLINATVANHAVSATLAGLIYNTAKNYCKDNDKCELPMPIIAYGNTVSELSNHILDAQMGKGSNNSPISSILTYKKPEDDSRNWLYKKMVADICPNPRGGAGECDEYPFNSSFEGGETNYALGGVSLRMIKAEHNNLGGRYLGNMYRKDKTQVGDKFLVMASPQLPESFYMTRKGQIRFF